MKSSSTDTMSSEALPQCLTRRLMNWMLALIDRDKLNINVTMLSASQRHGRLKNADCTHEESSQSVHVEISTLRLWPHSKYNRYATELSWAAFKHRARLPWGQEKVF